MKYLMRFEAKKNSKGPHAKLANLKNDILNNIQRNNPIDFKEIDDVINPIRDSVEYMEKEISILLRSVDSEYPYACRLTPETFMSAGTDRLSRRDADAAIFSFEDKLKHQSGLGKDPKLSIEYFYTAKDLYDKALENEMKDIVGSLKSRGYESSYAIHEYRGGMVNIIYVSKTVKLDYQSFDFD